MNLRQYQKDLASEACKVLKSKRIVYLCMEVRTGKTLTSLEIANLYGSNNVLFITKKKAVPSIESDYNKFGFKFNLTVVNDESLHKVKGNFDLVIHDEHHRFGAFPKPNATAKLFKKLYGNLPMIFLSGTPSPESHSQWYHQFWVSSYSPFNNYATFYKWANDYVNIKIRNLGYAKVNDYTEADRDKIMKVIDPYLIRFTQSEAGFTTTVNETILEVEMKPLTYQIISKLKKDLVIENKAGKLILADTGVKLMQKIHQLSSGTVKFECGDSMIVDYSKAEFIFNYFKGAKVGIFYKFVEELNALKEIFKDNLTTDLEEFNTTDKSIALQIVSGREGISLKNADKLVYYNIDFSAVSYWQSRDRLTTMDRTENNIYWVFAKGGIEYKIYKTVQEKKDYTLKIFKHENT
jgi:hypothetical protein